MRFSSYARLSSRNPRRRFVRLSQQRLQGKIRRYRLLERLEDRRLLAGDVCFPLTPTESISRADGISSAELSLASDVTAGEVYGPLQLASGIGESELGEGLELPIVSILPATGDEGDPLRARPVANASSPSPNTLEFTVMLNEPAPGTVSVDVSTFDGSAKGLVVERLVSGLANPVYATFAPGDNDRLFVIEQRSGIRIIDLNTGTLNATPFLSIPDLNQNNGEGGLIGLAFHPDYANNGRFFVNMTNNRQPVNDNTGDTFIREYQVSSNPDVAVQAPVQTILTVIQPFGNHNGGWLDFGPDGYLYIALGDGGSGHDPGDRAQNKNNLLGKMLRIDINGDDFAAADRNYAIPPDNPFAGPGVDGADEVWAYGLRNHYRNSFDRETGDLYIADVGQARREEIDVQPATSAGGENYGWRLREGIVATPTGGIGGPKPAGAIDPIFDYRNGTDDYEGESITGGYVYRGPIDDLQGQYFFADFVRSHIWSLTYNGDAPNQHDGTNFDGLTDWMDLLLPDVGSINSISSFGEDAEGNLYIVDYGGEIFAIRNGADFVPTTQTIDFDTGEQSKTFEVPIVHDILQEFDESFQATIVNASGATIGAGTATGMITNDDGSPSVSSAIIEDGSDQRSLLRSVTVTFDGVVDTPASAFGLFNTGTMANPSNTEVTSLIVTRQVVGLQTIATLSFGSGPSVVDLPQGNSLDDGNYELSFNGSTILGAQMADDFFRDLSGTVTETETY